MCVYVQKKSKFLVQERYADSQTVEIAKRGVCVEKDDSIDVRHGYVHKLGHGK